MLVSMMVKMENSFCLIPECSLEKKENRKVMMENKMGTKDCSSEMLVNRRVMWDCKMETLESRRVK